MNFFYFLSGKVKTISDYLNYAVVYEVAEKSPCLCASACARLVLWYHTVR